MTPAPIVEHANHDQGEHDAPRHDRLDLKPLYIDHAGERWRVHDCAYRDRKFARVAIESPRAKYRVFVSESGWRKAYLFKREDSRSIDRAGEQIARAGFIQPFPANHKPIDWREEANRRDAETRPSRVVARAMAKAAAVARGDCIR